MTPNGVRMLKPHSSWMPSLNPVGLGRGHYAPLLGQSRAGLLCGNRVSSYATRGFLMMLAIRHITSLPKVIRAIGKIEKIVDMILRAYPTT